MKRNRIVIYILLFLSKIPDNYIINTSYLLMDVSGDEVSSADVGTDFGVGSK
jgi:hypothetical protein